MSTQVLARDIQKKAIPACSKCGSSDVCVEAFAVWSPHLQDWRLAELLDGNSACNHCGQDCQITWKLT